MFSQMEQWSILSNVINYVQYSKNPRNFHTMSIKPINKNKINVGRKEGDKKGQIHITGKSQGHFR